MFRKRSASERIWEILPGFKLWIVFFSAIFFSYYWPVAAALFIICFDLYWIFKSINVSAHLVASYKKFKFVSTVNWLDYIGRAKDLNRLLEFFKTLQLNPKTSGLEKKFYGNEIKKIRNLINEGREGGNYLNYFQLILIPFFDESFEVLDSTFQALSASRYPQNNIIIVLAGEERAGESAKIIGERIKTKYKGNFFKFFMTWHPDGLEDEIKGKSANASYAIKQILPELEVMNVKVPQVLVSNLDSDTIVHPQYFARVMYEFLTARKPYQSSYQPIAVFNNNIWDTPALIRVVSVSNSFWQFTESSRPDRLRTFSSHTMTLKALIEANFWRKDIVNEDGYIYWQCYLRYNGDYQVIPLFIPISLDTCLAKTTWQTLVNQYKQKRRWAYNVEYYPHLLPQMAKCKAPFWDKVLKIYQYVESNFNWAAAPILISCLGWLPLVLGGPTFRDSAVGYNLPFVTKMLMTAATFFLIFSVYINLLLLPPRPKKYSALRSVMMYLQWFLFPPTSVIFGSLPSVEAQTRLMFGWYLEFWVTPKTRKGQSTGLAMREMQSIKTS